VAILLFLVIVSNFLLKYVSIFSAIIVSIVLVLPIAGRRSPASYCVLGASTGYGQLDINTRTQAAIVAKSRKRECKVVVLGVGWIDGVRLGWSL
jgi:hypothetical protein